MQLWRQLQGLLSSLDGRQVTKGGNADTIIIRSCLHSMRMNHRVIALDFVRGLACLMVLGVHILQVYGKDLSCCVPERLIYFLMTPCDGLFLMVTGCVLLRDKRLTAGFFVRRVVNIYLPLSVVTFLIIFCGLGTSVDKGSFLLTVLRKPICPSYWFFYSLLGIYILSMPMNELYRRYGMRFLRCTIAMWLVELLALFGLVVAGLGSGLIDFLCEWPFLLSSFFWGFLPFGKYMYEIAKRPLIPRLGLIPCFFMPICLGAVYACKDPELSEFVFRNYLSPISVCLTCCMFYIIVKHSSGGRFVKALGALGRYSLWFCLIHVLPFVF